MKAIHKLTLTESFAQRASPGTKPRIIWDDIERGLVK
jgi:hypothetical protein